MNGEDAAKVLKAPKRIPIGSTIFQIKSARFPKCSDDPIGANMQNFARTSPKSGGKVGERFLGIMVKKVWLEIG